MACGGADEPSDIDLLQQKDARSCPCAATLRVTTAS